MKSIEAYRAENEAAAARERRQRRRRAVALARELVHAYLRDCGGRERGFCFGPHEERLSRAIADAVERSR